MKALLVIAFCCFISASYGQTAKELIGKWKLVKQTGGAMKASQNTFQVFMEDGEYLGLSDGKSGKGKWKLSGDNKILTIKIGIISVKFTVDYFDAKKRRIISKQTGTLEYEKVEQ